MNYKILIITFVLLLSLATQGHSQQLVFVHKPFVENDIQNYRYSQDTTSFSTNSQILGLIYLPNADKDLPKIKLSIKNHKGNEKTASFHLQQLDPSQLNWHKHIKKWYQYLLKSPHWYYFEITPNPSVINAIDGVAFLEVIQESAQTSTSESIAPSFFSYRVEGDTSTNSCAIDFRSKQGFFTPLWKKLGHYQQVLANKKDLEGQQVALRKQCEPNDFTQISQWADESKGLKTDLKSSDLSIFQAVENLKIITEAIPDSISKELKRALRALLILDISILETTKATNKAKKIKRKDDLVKQLSLYPELNSILNLYKNKNSQVISFKEIESKQESELDKVSSKFSPYEDKYTAHQKLQVELNELDKQLVKFD
jgi:hypothetical protein